MRWPWQKSKEVRYYKVLDSYGRAPFALPHMKYSLPTKDVSGEWTPGEWMPEVDGKLKRCKNGYHFCEAKDLAEWIGYARYRLFRIETRGKVKRENNKSLARSVRLLYEVPWNSLSSRDKIAFFDLSLYGNASTYRKAGWKKDLLQIIGEDND